MIIPAINVKTFSEAEKQIRQVEPYAEWAHIDVVDGKFAGNVTFGATASDAAKFKSLKEQKFQSLKFEAHLMVVNSEEHIERWLEAGAKRIIVHWESLKSSNVKAQMSKFSERVKSYGAELFLALNPETDIREIQNSKFKIQNFGIDGFLILGVNPGMAGQEFQESVLEKISVLCERFPRAKIELDGGITPEIIQKSLGYGKVDYFVSASFIFSHPKGAEQSIEELSAAAM